MCCQGKDTSLFDSRTALSRRLGIDDYYPRQRPLYTEGEVVPPDPYTVGMSCFKFCRKKPQITSSTSSHGDSDSDSDNDIDSNSNSNSDDNNDDEHSEIESYDSVMNEMINNPIEKQFDVDSIPPLKSKRSVADYNLADSDSEESELGTSSSQEEEEEVEEEEEEEVEEDEEEEEVEEDEEEEDEEEEDAAISVVDLRDVNAMTFEQLFDLEDCPCTCHKNDNGGGCLQHGRGAAKSGESGSTKGSSRSSEKGSMDRFPSYDSFLRKDESDRWQKMPRIADDKPKESDPRLRCVCACVSACWRKCMVRTA